MEFSQKYLRVKLELKIWEKFLQQILLKEVAQNLMNDIDQLSGRSD